jgi:methyl-accepting chemotaxis protein
MTLYAALQSNAGLAALYFLQTAFFGMLVYILTAEYLRTGDRGLRYKLFAAGSITLMNAITAGMYYLRAYSGYDAGDRYLPLILNSAFVAVVLALSRAFVYEFFSAAQKRGFDWFFRGNLIAAGLGYIVLQLDWLREYSPGRSFAHSHAQLAFSVYFAVVLGLIIWITIRFRKKYRLRLAIAFAAILAVQIIRIYAYFASEMSGGLKILQAGVTILVPIMLGTVVFKELIEKNLTMAGDLRRAAATQTGVVQELASASSRLDGLSDTLLHKSGEAWTRLAAINDLTRTMERLPEARDSISEKVRVHSRDIEMMAGLTEDLKSVADSINQRTRQLSQLTEQISYVNR